MTATRILDLRGIGSEERAERIFSALEGLRTGESLQVVLEQYPLSLAYALKASGEFNIAYLNQSPPDWKLEFTRKAQPADKTEQLKEMLRVLKQSRISPEARRQARELMKVLDAATLGLLERQLIREGITREEIRAHLCDIHLEVLAESLAARRIEVQSPHPVRLLMEEHKAILDSLNALNVLLERFEARGSFDEAGKELAELCILTRRLLEAESHHRREEEVIFPRLERYGISEPPAILKADHEQFRERKRRLLELAEADRSGSSFEQWRGEVEALSGSLSRELASHIFKEDNILYQMALQVFNSEDWEEVKRESDRIGYCRFASAENPQPEPVELDMRRVPMLQRQSRIMEAWKALPAGGALRLTVDREPKPLFFVFQSTQRGKFEWTYEKQGPTEWVASIRKL